MKKKKILLLTSIASIAAFSTAAMLLSNTFTVRTTATEIYHDFLFTGDDCLQGGPYSGGSKFQLIKQNVLPGENDISTFSEETYISTSGTGSLDFQVDGNIAQAVDPGDIEIRIEFALDPRATLDLDVSYVALIDVGEPFELHFNHLDNEEYEYTDGLNHYRFEYTVSRSSGPEEEEEEEEREPDVILLEKVYIYFTCSN